jgi:hypothetical protein
MTPEIAEHLRELGRICPDEDALRWFYGGVSTPGDNCSFVAPENCTHSDSDEVTSLRSSRPPSAGDVSVWTHDGGHTRRDSFDATLIRPTFTWA